MPGRTSSPKNFSFRGQARSRVAVLAFQCLSALGDQSSAVPQVLAGRNALHPLRLDGFPDLFHGALRDFPASAGETDPDPTVGLALRLSEPLINQAEGRLRHFDPSESEHLLIAAGCSKGLIRNAHNACATDQFENYPDHPTAGYLPSHFIGRAAARRGLVSITGNYPAACATGLACMIMACEGLNRGTAHAAIAGALEFTAYPPALASFLNMGALTPAPCRPFDVSRCGFNSGDGGALFLLAPANGAVFQRVTPIAYITGWDIRSSGHHLTAAEPDGSTLSISIQRTLQKAGWEPGDVDGICAHATGTPANDLAEALAIWRVFGRGDWIPPVFSFKGAIGHLLGASSATELALAMALMQTGWIGGNPGLERLDPRLPSLPISASPRPSARCRRLLKLALGFGGPVATMAVELNMPISQARSVH